MKKRMFALLLTATLIAGMAGCSSPEKPQYEVFDTQDAIVMESPFSAESPAIDDLVVLPYDSLPVPNLSGAASGEIRAVWVSYLEMANLLTGKSEKQFIKNISQVFDNIDSYGLNTVIVQVRPFADALYESQYFPWSYMITGTEGKNPGFDPLKIMVDQAHARGLRIEAWLNPYRVRAAGNTKKLASGNQAQIWLDNDSDAVISYNGVISYNPASPEARSLIVNGVTEIVQNYDVDGIHIDDYFYPSTDKAFDEDSYQSYKNGGGELGLADWRRSNVEKLIRRIYKAIKAENSSVVFGISPQSSVASNYSKQYLDVEKIAGSSGYCDYICPQIYFGYDNESQPYKETLKQWSSMVKGSSVQLYVGIASYKIGATDSWAGSGKNEWVKNTDLMKQMVTDARSSNNYQGFVLYRYDSIFNPSSAVKSSVQKENRDLQSIL